MILKYSETNPSKLPKNIKKVFLKNQNEQRTYKLVNCNLALFIMLNRRRIGDVKFLKIKDFMDYHRCNFIDFEAALKESEVMLTKTYKLVFNRGKFSNP